MQFEGHSFCDAESLFRAARSSVAAGRWRAIGRDGEEPALLWLDRLALQRTDWHDALTEVWARLLTDTNTDLAGAALDALDRGTATPAFVPALEGVVGADAATSLSLRDIRPDAAPLRLGDVIERQRPHHKRWSGNPALIVLRTPAMEIVRLHDGAEITALARRCAAHGASLTGGNAAGHFALDWLRALALFTPWVRPLVVPTLTQLLHGDAPERRAALEYAVRAGDRREIADAVVAAARSDTAFAATPLAHGPLAVSLAPASTVADLARWLVEQAQIERSSAPPTNAAQA